MRANDETQNRTGESRSPRARFFPPSITSPNPLRGTTYGITTWSRTDLRADTFRDSRFDLNDVASADNKAEGAVDVVRRKKELKEMRDAHLISENEYEEKRAEMMKEL